MKKITINDLEKAHEHSSDNRDEISESKLCGCFYCLKVFKSSEIKMFINDTAFCPNCNVDSIIGDASGFPITKEFLEKFKKYQF